MTSSPLQGETIEEDLRRRDFTVNAMARPLRQGGGADRPARRAAPTSRPRTLRVLGAEAYESDPLRALRLARFAAELGFAPDAETERLTRAAAPRVAEAAGERVFAELRRLVIADGVLDGLALADRLGVLEAVLPELTALHGVEQSRLPPPRRLRPHARGAGAADRARARLDERFGATPRAARRARRAARRTSSPAARRCASARCCTTSASRPRATVRPDGRVTFMGHDARRRGDGARRCAGACARASGCRASSRRSPATTWCSASSCTSARSTARQVYRYLKRTSPVEVEVTLLSCADRLATRGRKAERGDRRSTSSWRAS